MSTCYKSCRGRALSEHVHPLLAEGMSHHMVLQGKCHCPPEKNLVALMVLVNTKTDSCSLLPRRLWPPASDLRHTGWCGSSDIFPRLPEERETLPGMLLGMNGWLPCRPGGGSFCVFLHPHHQPGGYLFRCSPSAHKISAVGTQPLQTAHQRCTTAAGIYLLSLMLERPQKTCTCSPRCYC